MQNTKWNRACASGRSGYACGSSGRSCARAQGGSGCSRSIAPCTRNEERSCPYASEGGSCMKEWDYAGGDCPVRSDCRASSDCAARNDSMTRSECRAGSEWASENPCARTACTETESDCLSGMVSLGMVYGPCQAFTDLYDLDEGLENGTVFRALNMPFRPGYGCGNPNARRGCGN